MAKAPVLLYHSASSSQTSPWISAVEVFLDAYAFMKLPLIKSQGLVNN